jgi:hypothetical protein
MFNPEFRRYVWLELTRHRLIAVPGVLAAILVVVLSSASEPAEFLTYGGLGAFVAFAGFYGSMRAFGSVSEEARDRTWDFQRMSALSPWSLALGKVAGAPVFAWYAGVWFLLAFVLGALGNPKGFDHLAATLVGLLAGSVLAHAMAVSISAASSRSGLGARGRRVGSILGLFTILYVGSTLSVLFFAGRGGKAKEELTVTLFGVVEMSVPWWGALTIVLLGAWALVSAWRMMARELREPPIWSIWVGFAAFVAVWATATQFSDQARLPVGAALSFFVVTLVVAAYLGLMLEPLTAVARTRFARLREASPPVAWDKKLPHWIIHAGIALAVAVVAVALSGIPDMGDLAGKWSSDTSLLVMNSFALLTALPAVLMFIRDAAIVSCFTLARSQKRPFATAIFYIALLNFLLPLLFSAVGLKYLAMAAMPFARSAGTSVWLPAVGFAVHAIIALAVLWALHSRADRAPAG